MKLSNKVTAFASAFSVALVAMTAVAFAAAPTASTIASDTATGLRDQFLPAMVVAIPIILTVVVAKRVYRWVRGQ